MEVRTQYCAEIAVTKLDIRDGEDPEKDEIMVEVKVDIIEEESNKEEETVSNKDMEYNVTVEC
jgi:hypothetical protein